MVSEVDLNQTLLLRWQLLQHAVGSEEAEEGLVEEDLEEEEGAGAVSVAVVHPAAAVLVRSRVSLLVVGVDVV